MASKLSARLKVAGAALAAVFGAGCVHDFVPVKVGKVLHRKGYRAGGKHSRVGVAAVCRHCQAVKADWVPA